MKLLTTILSMTLVAANVYAAAPGGHGGSGGDPVELLETAVGAQNITQSSLYKKSIKHESTSVEIQAAVRGWQVLTEELFGVLSTGGNFKGQPVLSSLSEKDLEQTFKAASLTTINDFSMPGPNGDQRRALFASYPQQQAIEINAPYWNEIFNVMKFRSSSKQLWGSKQDGKRTAYYIFDLEQLDLAIVGVVFHEAMVLKGLEESRSYQYSSIFVREVQAAWQLGTKSLMVTADGKSFYQKLKPKLHYLDANNIDPMEIALTAADITGLDLSSFENGEFFIADADLVKRLAEQEAFEPCKVKIAQMIARQNELNDKISATDLQLAVATDPVECDALSMKLADLRGEQALLSAKMTADAAEIVPGAAGTCD